MPGAPQTLPLGSLIVDFEGTALQPEDCEVLCHPLVGGVILFTRNFEAVAQVVELNEQIRALRSPHLAISVDQEGGRVQRFKDGFTPLPAAASFGKSYRQVEDAQRQQAYDACKTSGWLMAAELRAVGVDLSYAPVVDLDWGASEVIGTRSFHRSPYAVNDLASQYIAGMHQAGMKSVLKHFPGHGYVRADSHLSLPEDTRSFTEIYGEDMIPFEHLGQMYKEGLMTAHIVFSQVDDSPVTFSHRWLQHVLRDQLAFEGVVFSDDLNMEAARSYGSAAERAQMAFQAGCDVALLCNNRPEVIEVLDQMGGYRNPVGSARLSRMRGSPVNQTLEELRASEAWQKAHDTVLRYVDEAIREPELDL